MAEFTELFPLGEQFDGLMHVYVYVITFDLPTLFIVLFILTALFFILYRILNGLFFWLLEMRPIEHDIEEGNTNTHLANYGETEPSHHFTIFHALVHPWALVAAFEGAFNEKRGQRLRASKKLPPLVNYGKHGVTRSCGEECAICMEEFKVSQLCQVFPECKHIFHSDCIDHWLQKKLTCPICRSCI
ncbi:putative RING-H2 finger protein ATL19 [Glycine soja]|uniref:Putative RING-H2 finger protein ATL19 n=1 Tax=Glycine soja TaxID=3848 RepID=A0A0B2QXS8_GLYSO|nr:putative RING-H2 finger protein ATL19 [Glycine soja]KHN24809.1 Putative RING-H2 finger protein ATL19 [Glycine soja]